MRNTYYGDYSYMYRVDEQRNRRLARARQVRREKMYLIIGVLITMALITMALCSFFSIKAFANTDNTSADSFGTKQYRSIMIYCGDTVENIAEDNYTPEFSSAERLAGEIMNINHISSDETLIPGNYIVIPYYDEVSGR